jgi:hypothetical protein
VSGRSFAVGAVFFFDFSCFDFLNCFILHGHQLLLLLEVLVFGSHISILFHTFFVKIIVAMDCFDSFAFRFILTVLFVLH